MRFTFYSTLLLAVLACPGFSAAQDLVLHRTDGANEIRVFDLALPSGEKQRVLHVAPKQHAWASVVMLPGGAGNIGIERDGDIRHGDNFLVRSRDRWMARGYAVVIPDTINRANLRGERSKSSYAAVVAELIAFAHTQAKGPVFLIGTSQGSIAAMNGAAHAAPGSLAGVVLTESVSILGGSHETVFDADPGAVHVPALVVANKQDACNVAPPGQAPKIAAAMSASPSVEVLYVDGGRTVSPRACGSLSPHGYLGIEEEVVSGIDRWMRKHQ